MHGRRQHRLPTRADDLDDPLVADAPAARANAEAMIEPGFASRAGLLGLGRRQHRQQGRDDRRILGIDVDADQVTTGRASQDANASIIAPPRLALAVERAPTVKTLGPLGEPDPVSVMEKARFLGAGDDWHDGITALEQTLGVLLKGTHRFLLAQVRH